MYFKFIIDNIKITRVWQLVKTKHLLIKKWVSYRLSLTFITISTYFESANGTIKGIILYENPLLYKHKKTIEIVWNMMHLKEFKKIQVCKVRESMRSPMTFIAIYVPRKTVHRILNLKYVSILCLFKGTFWWSFVLSTFFFNWFFNFA